MRAQRQQTPALVRGVVVVLALVVSAAAAGSPAGAQAPPVELTPEQIEARDATLALQPDQPASPDDPFQAVRDAEETVAEAALARLDAAGRAEVATAELATAMELAVGAQQAWKQADDTRKARVADLQLEREKLSALGAQAFMNGGATELQAYSDLLNGDTTDQASGRRLMFSQVIAYQQLVTTQAKIALAAARDALATRRQARDAANTEVANRNEVLQQRNAERTAAEQTHLEALDAATAARERLRTAGRRGAGLVPEGVSLIGLPRLAPEDLVAWFRAGPYNPQLKAPIEDYARWFIEEGAAEGIRGDIAFAQAVLETGGFANNDTINHNNFSGIGHCDTCESGWHFPSPQLGVRAQIQLLKSYAVRKPQYANPLVDKRLRGPAGCCPTWGDLTTVWATDPGYAPKVMLIYTSMVQTALARRAAGA